MLSFEDAKMFEVALSKLDKAEDTIITLRDRMIQKMKNNGEGTPEFFAREQADWDKVSSK